MVGNATHPITINLYGALLRVTPEAHDLILRTAAAALDSGDADALLAVLTLGIANGQIVSPAATIQPVKTN